METMKVLGFKQYGLQHTPKNWRKEGRGASHGSYD